MVKIEIKDTMYEEIKKLVDKGMGFGSVEDYVNFVLSEVLKDEDEEEENLYSEEDEEQVTERLRDLGYL